MHMQKSARCQFARYKLLKKFWLVRYSLTIVRYKRSQLPFYFMEEINFHITKHCHYNNKLLCLWLLELLDVNHRCYSHMTMKWICFDEGKLRCLNVNPPSLWVCASVHEFCSNKTQYHNSTMTISENNNKVILQEWCPCKTFHHNARVLQVDARPLLGGC